MSAQLRKCDCGSSDVNKLPGCYVGQTTERVECKSCGLKTHNRSVDLMDFSGDPSTAVLEWNNNENIFK